MDIVFEIIYIFLFLKLIFNIIILKNNLKLKKIKKI